MTHLVVYIPKKEAEGNSIYDLFPEGVVSKIPGREAELIEELVGYTLRVDLGINLPEKKDLRVALANLDNHLGKIGISNYAIWISIFRLELANVFYRASKGEDVNGKIESELNKVYNFGLQKDRA